MNARRPATQAMPHVARMVEDIVGCKWSLAVLGAVRSGVRRPGAMEHAIDGLSKKVLNERLSKLVRFGILEKQAYPELPPRVEYRFTPFGEKFLGVLDSIDALQRGLDGHPT
ncbi:MAG: helix-turn-helix transcriptional regulator [Burkholderiaceae bacterium]|nr:helix-turn-helix transcriptional regulator [Burkholderiaceae bacterium]